MERVKSKLLLVVLAIMLCFMPMFMFGGCDNTIANDTSLNKFEKITNVQTVSVSTNKTYRPYEGNVWFDKQGQRMIFYVGADYINEQCVRVQKYDYPSNQCNLIYFLMDL